MIQTKHQLRRAWGKIWPADHEQRKAWGQVSLTFGVAAILAFVTMTFHPPENLEWYIRAEQMSGLVIVAMLGLYAGLALHRMPANGNTEGEHGLP